MNPLFTDNNHEQTYHEQPKTINFAIGDDQINSDNILNDPNVEVNNGSVEHDKYVHDSYKLEQLARNAFKESDKQKTIANKIKQQNVELTKQLEQYKERVRVFETNIFRQNSSRLIAKQNMNADEDKYLDNVLNLEEKLKKNEIVVEQFAEQKYFSSVSTTSETSSNARTSALKHDVEKCVLMCNDFMNVTSLDEIEKVKRESIDVQENFYKRIKILINLNK
ncbi:hypothetical protein Tco_1241946 [Tanacetum coccineum]